MAKTPVEQKRFEDIILGFPVALAHGNVTFHFQPIVNSIDSSCIATEILVRWNDPKLGNVYPDEFVPILEEAQLVSLLGSESLDVALRTFLAWKDMGITQEYISVNVSPVELDDDSFAARVLKTIGIHQINTHCLQFEITEGQQLHHLTTARKNVNALSKAGIQIALDDFGTGNSGIARLMQLPIDVIKLARPTCQRHLRDPRGLGRLHVIAQFAQQKGLGIVAEGIEEGLDVARLAGIGITDIQGYVYSKPLDAVGIETFLQDHLMTKSHDVA